MSTTTPAARRKAFLCARMLRARGIPCHKARGRNTIVMVWSGCWHVVHGWWAVRHVVNLLAACEMREIRRSLQ